MSEWLVEKLRPNPRNPRANLRDKGFEELVASIRAQGILQPILITKDGMVLAGHRRLEAAKVAELETVPVRILAKHNPDDLVSISLIENLLRTDLAPLEVGQYILQCQEQNGLSAVEISEISGITTATIYKYLRLMKGPEEIKTALAEDRIGVRAAIELSRQEPEVVTEVLKLPTITMADVQTQSSGSKPRRERTYQEQRRLDISLVLETLEKISERLEPYGVDPSATFAGVIRDLENQLAEAGATLARLQDHVIIWSMILRKQSDRHLEPVETRNRSSLLN